MTGDRLSSAARSFLHYDTYQLVVSPAIADLQFETPVSDANGVVRAYAAVWVAIVGALFIDLEHDVRVVLDDGPRLMWLSLMQAAYYVAMMSLLLDSLNASTSATLIGALLVISTVSTAALFWPTRRRDA
jgi:hypothetical protein